MAAPDMTVSRLGQANAGGDAKALFLKVYAGEVLTAFATATIAKGRHLERTIKFGKSAQFPATWKASAAYHTPGTLIVGTAIKHNERVISIDDLLLSDAFVANIDEAMNHYDVRSIYSVEQGLALAKQYDTNVLQVGVLAARASATIDVGPTGATITDANIDTDADILAQAIMTAGKELDENDVSESPRFAAFRPAQYWLLLNSDLAVNRDYTQGGSVQKGKVWEIGGIEILKSNNIPSTNVTSGPSAYQGDFSKTYGLVWHPTAMGTVKLMDLALESEYLIQYQGTLMVAKYAVGHGILRPECAVEIAKP